MSAAEIIEEIRKLPAPEQEQVRAFLEKACSARKDASRASYASEADFEKSAGQVMHEHADLFRRLAQ